METTGTMKEMTEDKLYSRTLSVAEKENKNLGQASNYGVGGDGYNCKYSGQSTIRMQRSVL